MTYRFCTLLACLLCWGYSSRLAAQGTFCNNAVPFYSSYPTFSLPVNAAPAPIGNNYDCLGTQPNPAWFYLRIAQSGNLSYTISGSAGYDIDFILYGPFTSIAAATAQCGNLGTGLNTGTGVNGGNVIDCSYSASGTEVVDIASAQAGEVYIMLVTNFSNMPVVVNTSAVSGTATLGLPCTAFTNTGITLAANNVSGTLTATNNSGGGDLKICTPNTRGSVDIGFRATNSTDVLTFNAANSNMGGFSPSEYTVSTSYPVGGQTDTMLVHLELTPNAQSMGNVRQLSLAIENTDINNTSCIQTIPITAILPGIVLADEMTCAGNTIYPLPNAMPTTSGGSATYTFTQIGGSAVTITNVSSFGGTSILTPSSFASGAAQIVGTITYGGCSASDTFTIDADTLVSMPLTICAGNTVSLGVSTSSSTPLYYATYVWSPAASLNDQFAEHPLATPSTTTTYNVTVIEGNCVYEGSQTVVVNNFPTFTVAATGSTLTCAGDMNGTAGVTVTGGSVPYQYLWNVGAVTPTLTGLSGGIYEVTVTDANGCLDVSYITVTEPDYLWAYFSNYSDANCTGSNSGSAEIDVFGGTAPYQYLWSNGATTSGVQTGLSQGVYIVTVVDANGCSSISDSVVLDSVGTINQSEFYTLCWGDSILINGSYVYTDGVYYDTIPGVGGCDTVIIYNVYFDYCTEVWPGDANADQIVDNNDLLPIGLYNTSTGYSRTPASIAWQGFLALDWYQYQLNWTDLKHTDCDGNGTIEDADTTAVSVNYGQTHLRTGHYNLDTRNGAPTLSFVPQQATYAIGETVHIDVMLGDANNIASNLYGVAFKLRLGDIFMPNSVQWAWTPSSFMGNSAATWKLTKVLEPAQQVDVAMVRHDGIGMGGYGKIAELTFVLREDLLDSAGQLYVIDYQAVNPNGEPIILNPQTTDLDIDLHPTGVRTVQASANRLQILPNPYQQNGILQYELVQDADAQLAIYNALGQRVHSAALGTQSKGTYQYLLPAHLTNGAYWLELQTNQQKSQIKFVKLD